MFTKKIFVLIIAMSSIILLGCSTSSGTTQNGTKDNEKMEKTLQNESQKTTVQQKITQPTQAESVTTVQ